MQTRLSDLKNNNNKKGIWDKVMDILYLHI